MMAMHSLMDIMSNISFRARKKGENYYWKQPNPYFFMHNVIRVDYCERKLQNVSNEDLKN